MKWIAGAVLLLLGAEVAKWAGAEVPAVFLACMAANFIMQLEVK
jgi:hypothetical protein